MTLIDLNELAKEIRANNDVMKEIQRYKDKQYLERLKYWSSDEGQARLSDYKLYETVPEVIGFKKK